MPVFLYITTTVSSAPVLVHAHGQGKGGAQGFLALSRKHGGHSSIVASPPKPPAVM